MTTERQSFVMPRKSRFESSNDRTELFFYLNNLGMRNLQTNIPLITPMQKNFMFKCLKTDLGIPERIKVWVKWFDTGSVFSMATDAYGNMAFNIELGQKRIPMSVSFDKRRNCFLALYYNDQLTSFQNIKNLL